VKILTVSGTLRAISSSGAVLEATALLAPRDVRLERYEGLARLPHFNPDEIRWLRGARQGGDECLRNGGER